MKKELDEDLVKRYPLLYADRHKSVMETAMCWGFPGDGWYHLLNDLSAELEHLIREWVSEHGTENHPRASQVKEKFGTLRFYMTGETDEMEDLIDEAEKLSAETCEDCGRTGELRDSFGWLATLCKTCFEKWKKSHLP